jgi:hypothetical protein
MRRRPRPCPTRRFIGLRASRVEANREGRAPLRGRRGTRCRRDVASWPRRPSAPHRRANVLARRQVPAERQGCPAAGNRSPSDGPRAPVRSRQAGVHLTKVALRERSARPRFEVLLELDRSRFVREFNGDTELPWPVGCSVPADARVVVSESRPNVRGHACVRTMGLVHAAYHVNETLWRWHTRADRAMR